MKTSVRSKKRFILFCFVGCLAFGRAQAQWVNVPDARFRELISYQAPSAFSGTMMDTTNAELLNITELWSYNSIPITDIDAVQYLDNLVILTLQAGFVTSISRLPEGLVILDLDMNNLTSLPRLPAGLRELNCRYNLLTSLPVLPASLEKLICSYNSFTSLPSSLPDSLWLLDCGNNQLSSLPVLPAKLTDLYCADNSLTSIPSLPGSLLFLDCSANPLSALPVLPVTLQYLSCGRIMLPLPSVLPPGLGQLICDNMGLLALPTLPATLTSLYCSNNNLTTLPSLPPGMNILNCSYNALISLPALPASLWVLDANYNSLTFLPALPDNINYLICDHNQLTALPALSYNLFHLDCSNNLLTALPALPDHDFWQLICEDNDINCMPLLPHTLSILWGANNNYTCLPNMPSLLGIMSGPSDVCDAFNTSCSIYPHVTGSTYIDDNLNGQRDPGEERHKGLTVYMQPGNNIFSDNDSGYFDFTVDTGLAFTITHSSLPYYNIIPGTHTTPALGFDMVDSLNDFILQRTGLIHDLTIIATGTTAARVGMDNYIQVHAGNKGTVTDTASVRFVIDSNLTYIAAAPPPSSVSGDTLQWDNVILEPGGLADFEITVHLDNLIPLGTDLFSVASISPVANDTVPADNVYTSEQEAVGSFDPNDKAVTPEGDLPQAAFENGQWLDYTIRFQNTGNAEAFIVEIKDTLSSNIYTNTLQVIAASHDMVWNVRSKLATFTFKDINLADSTSNEPASHGFVRYKVKADTSLLPGAAITNTAYIYFDANPPVQTNTVTTMVKFPAGLKTSTVPSLALFPNPVHDKLHIQNSAKGECIVYSTIGQEVLRTNATPQTIIDVSGLANGVYFLQLKTETGSVMGKFVKD